MTTERDDPLSDNWREPKPEQARDTSGLRALDQRIRANARQPSIAGYQALVDDLRAALSEGAAPEERGLDVDTVQRDLDDLARRIAREPRYGWHGSGDLCLGPECGVLDEDGDHPSPDVHSNDWYEGYEAARHDLEAATPEGAAGEPVPAKETP
jgi:hypothetical protein